MWARWHKRHETRKLSAERLLGPALLAALLLLALPAWGQDQLCQIDDACDDGSFCEFPTGTCGAGGEDGTCQDVGDSCPQCWSPVCGCDGVTYANDDCLQEAGFSKKMDGLCFDAAETCEDHCGGPSEGFCWCDHLCEGIGDCCPDYEPVCVQALPPCPPNGGNGGDCEPGPDSCVDHCGGPSEDRSCWCDTFCEGIGDCCDNYAFVCVEECPDPNGDSCVDHCGGLSEDGSCHCDDACESRGDCCDDYLSACSVPPPGCEPGPDSCVGHCGGPSEDSSCWCDAFCVGQGDCCADYVPACVDEVCPGPPGDSCVGHCGGPSEDSSCWCDTFCVDNGDCCADHAIQCVPG